MLRGIRMKDKWVIVLFIHSILWSIFAIIEFLSTKDHLVAKVIMLVVFFFIAFQISKHFIQSNKMSFYITAIVMSLFFVGQRVFLIIV